MTRLPPPDGADEAAIAAWIAEVRRASEAGELLEEMPWTAEDEADAAHVFDTLQAEWSREAHVAALVQRRRERRRRRAWRLPLTDA